MQSQGKARFIKPQNKIKQKVGGGGFSPEAEKKGQTFIEETQFDFTPYAEKYLSELNAVVNDYEAGTIEDDEARMRIAATVMQLKANGGMFKYRLLSEIADTVLLLVENIESLNDDAVKILKAHQNSLQIIVTARLKGDGGREGAVLVDELNNACDRFYKKYDIEPE